MILDLNFYTTIAIHPTLVILWFAPKLETVSWSLTGGLALGGVVGNLIDRLTREPGFGQGHVVDFIQIPFNFPIFNFADICISVGMTLVAWRIMSGDKFGGKRDV